ncbi:GspH/FimT family pseudopilin [Lysobacter sp. A03]|uniref:GspH/FimT family pseudopilin n=1 Tax=Lysobacter sp. A03 TaxID=1199154 RepID=UPI000A62BDF1|nr:GspH/FimT family pseudopilin [Lysobacter sp. A03]
MRQDARGLTLLELLVAIAVMGVLLGVGVPSFKNLQRRMAADTTFHLITGALATARATAVTRGVPVSVCPSADGQRCDHHVFWEHGWIVFEDGGRGTQPASERAVLQRFGSLKGGITLRSTVGRTMLRFQPSGMSSGSNISLRLCSGSDDTHLGSVVVNNAGRARTERKQNEACPFALLGS